MSWQRQNAIKSYVIATADLWHFIYASNLLLSPPTPLPYIYAGTMLLYVPHYLPLKNTSFYLENINVLCCGFSFSVYVFILYAYFLNIQL